MQPGMSGWPPQPPAPQRKKRTGLIVSIVVGALVAAGGIAFGVMQLVDKGAEAVYPEAKYRLIVPKKLLDDEFTLDQDMSDTQGKEIEDTPDASIRDAQAAVAQYSSGDGAASCSPVCTGGSRAPASCGARSWAAPRTRRARRSSCRPRSSPRRLRHHHRVPGRAVDRGRAHDQHADVRVGDDNTAAMVAVIRPLDVVKQPKAIDLEKAAQETAKVRAELRKPIG
ncbi:hypothetical protein NKH18_34615 [Streptomyces sp. M10(2022)]